MIVKDALFWNSGTPDRPVSETSVASCSSIRKSARREAGGPEQNVTHVSKDDKQKYCRDSIKVRRLQSSMSTSSCNRLKQRTSISSTTDTKTKVTQLPSAVDKSRRPLSNLVIRRDYPDSRNRSRTSLRSSKSASTLTSVSRKPTIRSAISRQNLESETDECLFGASPDEILEPKTMTSKDMVVHLLNAWQPQLSESYRSSVHYIPTNPVQMRAFIDAMLLDKPRHYLEKFRTIGRIVGTMSRLRLNSHRHGDDDGLPTGFSLQSPANSQFSYNPAQPPSIHRYSQSGLRTLPNIAQNRPRSGPDILGSQYDSLHKHQTMDYLNRLTKSNSCSHFNV